ncbi:MAG: BLUF domain-containing protein [Phototrophicaceae bacterium]
MPLYALTYVSVATRPMTDQDILQILEVSRKNNAQQDITGMLLYRDSYFIQALEGDRDSLLALYGRINADERHRNVLTIYQGEIAERTFSNWSMGFHNLDTVDPATLEGYTDFLKQPSSSALFTQNPTRTQLLLSLFAEGGSY